MVRKSVFRKDRIVLALAVAGATLTGGIVSYSIAVASPAAPEVRSEMAVEGRPIDCNFPTPDLDWYRQRGDRMLSNEMLPNTVSFRSTSSGLRPAGDSCEDDGDGDGGGGGGSPCLSDFGFDPTDYWVVLEDTTLGEPTADIFAALDGSTTPLTADSIFNATGCTVTFEWWMVEVDYSFADLVQFWNMDGASVSATGITTTELAISGLTDSESDQWTVGSLYFNLVCGDFLGLKVSDGTDDYFITAPPCGTYNLSSLAISSGVGFKFEYQDPWSRAEVVDQNPDDLAPGGANFYSFAAVATVKLNSPLTITFYEPGFYTLKTGSDWQVNCDDGSLSVVFDTQSQAANSTWSEPTPSTDRFYCVTEELL